MTYLIKKLFTLILVPLLIACTPAKAAWPNWRDYFPSSLSVKRDNLKEWTIPVLGATALVTAGYFGYKYVAGRKQMAAAKTAPGEQQEPKNEVKPYAPAEPREEKAEDVQPLLTTRIWQYDRILEQIDAATCGFHSIKNAVELLCYFKTHDTLNNDQALEQCLSNEHLWDAFIYPYKLCIKQMRIKDILKTHIATLLSRCITDCSQKEKDTLRDALTNITRGLIDDALSTDKPYDITSTAVVDLLAIELESKRHKWEQDELRKPAYAREESHHVQCFKYFDASKFQDVSITKKLINDLLTDTILVDILGKKKLFLDREEQLLFTEFINTDNYDQLIKEVNEGDQNLNAEIKLLDRQMSRFDNIGPFLAKQTQLKRAWLTEKIKQYLPESLRAHTDTFIRNTSILDLLYDQRNLFADLQGFWLDGDEITTVLQNLSESPLFDKQQITVVLNEAVLCDKEAKEKIFQPIKETLLRSKKYTHAFLINTARESAGGEQPRGHWFTVIVHKNNNVLEFIVANSLPEKERYGASYDSPEVIEALRNQLLS